LLHFVDSTNCSLVVDVLYHLAGQFDLVELHEKMKKYIWCSDAKEFCPCGAEEHWHTINWP
jgi:hypothetical protein